MYTLVEVVYEDGDAFDGFFACLLDVHGELDFCLYSAAEVGDAVEGGGEGEALAAEDGLTEFHLVNAVVDEHLDVLHINDLPPEIREDGEGEVTVCDGGAKLALGLCALCVNVYPLVVERGIGKHVDAFLRELDVV